MNKPGTASHALCLVLFLSIHGAAQPQQSELERNIEMLQPYLNSDKVNLNHILRGLSWLNFDVHFRTDSTELDYFNQQQIYNVARLMKIYPMLRVGLSARTDIRGTKAHNEKLSRRRLSAVYEILAKVSKIDPQRIYTNSIGEINARYRPDDKEGLFYDRKVEIRLIVHYK